MDFIRRHGFSEMRMPPIYRVSPKANRIPIRALQASRRLVSQPDALAEAA
jgi:hypothetical protein